MLIKLVIIAMAAVLIGAAPSPYPPLLPAHSYSSVVHYPSYAYKYPYYGGVLPLSYPTYKYYGYGYPGSIYPYYYY